jgi:hypothetical protein
VTPTLSVDAVQLRFTWVFETAVALRFVGAVGACVSPPALAALKAASCMIQPPLDCCVRVAL